MLKAKEKIKENIKNIEKKTSLSFSLQRSFPKELRLSKNIRQFWIPDNLIYIYLTKLRSKIFIYDSLIPRIFDTRKMKFRLFRLVNFSRHTLEYKNVLRVWYWYWFLI